MSTDKAKKIISLFSSLLILAAYLVFLAGFLPTGALAAEAVGGAVPSSIFSGGNVIITHNDWAVDEKYDTEALSGKDGNLIQISSDDNRILTAATPDGDTDIAKCSEIGVFITSFINSKCHVTLTANFVNGTSSVTEDIPYGNEYYIFVPIPEDSGNIIDLSVSVTYKNNNKKAKILLGNAVLSEADHTFNINRYSAFSVSGVDDDGRVSNAQPLIGNNIINGAASDDLAIIARISGSGGGMTLHYSENGKDFSVFGSAVITEGRSHYIFRSENLGSNASYKLEFTGIGDRETIVHSVSFISLEKSSASSELGSVTRCHISDESSTLSVTGNVDRDTVIKHINGDICLFEVPMWDTESVHLYSADPIAVGNMSSSFSFSVDLKRDRSVFSSFIVAIRDNGKLYPLADPVFPSRETILESADALSSVCGIPCEDAFSAGFDNYIIHIDVDSFFAKKASKESTVFTFDGDSYYINKDSIASIDREISFLKAAGIGVIFNLTSSDDSPILNSKNETKCRIVAAVTSFLSQRYSPYGFMISTSTDSGLSISAAEAASTARLVSAAAGIGRSIYIPIEDVENVEVYTWLLSHYMSSLPKITANFIVSERYVSDSHGKAHIEAAISSGGSQTPVTILAEASGNDILSVVERLSSMGDMSYLIRISDKIPADLSLVSEKRLSATLPEDNKQYPSGTILWDFTSSYDSGGFTISPNSSGIFTRPDTVLEEQLGIRSCRSLKTVMNGDASVLLATPTYSMDLSSHPFFQFFMSCEISSPVTFDIIFISGHDRAIFTMTADSSGVYSPICDLSDTDIEHKIDRIALVLREGDFADIGIAKVIVYGDGASGDRANNIFITEETVTPLAPDAADPALRESTDNLYIYIGVVVAVTIVVFATLTLRHSKKP